MVKKIEDMFICFDSIHQRNATDGQTDGRTTPHDGIGLACIASRGKNGPIYLKTEMFLEGSSSAALHS